MTKYLYFVISSPAQRLHARTPIPHHFERKGSQLLWEGLSHSHIPTGWRLRKRQPVGMLGRSSDNHDWLLANASACVSCGFRFRNARNASDCV